MVEAMVEDRNLLPENFRAQEATPGDSFASSARTEALQFLSLFGSTKKSAGDLNITTALPRQNTAILYRSLEESPSSLR